MWVPIWEYSTRAIQWIPTWQGLNGFPKILRPCALVENSPSIGRVNLELELGGWLGNGLCVFQLGIDWVWPAAWRSDVLMPWQTSLAKYTVFWKPSKPCHVSIHWIALSEYSQMSTHVPGFQYFFHVFCIIVMRKLIIVWKAHLTLPMLRLLSSITQGHKDLWQPSKPCHVGID